MTKPKIKRICETCGKAFERTARNIQVTGARFCSSKCRAYGI